MNWIWEKCGGFFSCLIFLLIMLTSTTTTYNLIFLHSWLTESIEIAITWIPATVSYFFSLILSLTSPQGKQTSFQLKDSTQIFFFKVFTPFSLLGRIAASPKHPWCFLYRPLLCFMCVSSSLSWYISRAELALVFLHLVLVLKIKGSQ